MYSNVFKGIFTLEKNNFWKIKLTEDHLIYVVNGYPTATAAKNVKVGDVLKSKFGEFAVVAISTTLQYPVR